MYVCITSNALLPHPISIVLLLGHPHIQIRYVKGESKKWCGGGGISNKTKKKMKDEKKKKKKKMVLKQHNILLSNFLVRADLKRRRKMGMQNEECNASLRATPCHEEEGKIESEVKINAALEEQQREKITCRLEF